MLSLTAAVAFRLNICKQLHNYTFSSTIIIFMVYSLLLVTIRVYYCQWNHIKYCVALIKMPGDKAKSNGGNQCLSAGLSNCLHLLMRVCA